ncbi:hypothetical protein RRG08_017667 [Elysia crispata]|uniref:Uncharacterized protein n=1 Tax=Elysia crispata TaxID=231223 RepID=A0AAE0ZCL5_9GAST|nr:hypothetical protein RRG08_017667 [Elysia crispata]
MTLAPVRSRDIWLSGKWQFRSKVREKISDLKDTASFAWTRCYKHLAKRSDAHAPSTSRGSRLQRLPPPELERSPGDCEVFPLHGILLFREDIFLTAESHEIAIIS